MTLSCQDNNIAWFSVLDRVSDGFFAVRDRHIAASGRCDPLDNITDDIHRFLVARIIRRDDRQIGESSAGLSHLKTAGAGTVSTAAKQTDQPSGIIFPQGCQQTLQSHCIVGIVDHKGKVIAHLDHLDPAPHMNPAQSLTDVVVRNSEMPADGDGTESVVDAETARGRNMCMETDRSFGVKGDPQLSGCVDQLNGFSAQIILLSQTECLHLAGMSLQDPGTPGVVSVEDPDLTLTEQKALAVQIILEVSVFIGTDMVR